MGEKFPNEPIESESLEPDAGFKSGFSDAKKNLTDFLTFRTPNLKLKIRKLTSTGQSVRAEGSIVPTAQANGLGFASEM